jgi:hypothetical protein
MRDRNVVMLRGGSSFRVNMYRPRYAASSLRYEYISGVLRESRRDPVLTGLGITG